MILFKPGAQMPPDVEAIFEHDLQESHIFVDGIFAKLFLAQWFFGIVCAYWVSPLSWSGTQSEVHVHVWSAIVLGGLIAGPPLLLTKLYPGKLVTRMAVAAGQLLFSCLLIHLMGGRIEAHFHVFVSLAILSTYRDRTVFLPAVMVTVVDHIVRGFYWPQSVFGDLVVIPWRPFEHAAWVAFETVCLCFLIRQNLDQFKTLATLQWSLKQERDLLESRVHERTEELRESKEFQEVILNSIDAKICLLNDEGEIFFANEQWNEFGQTDGGLQSQLEIGANYLEVFQNDHGPYAEQSQRLADAVTCLRSGKTHTYTAYHPFYSPTQTRWFHIYAKQVVVDGEQTIALIHIEVTATKQAQARAESLAKLILNSPDEVYIMDAKTLRFVEVNQGACKNLGYDREALLQMTPADIKPDYNEEQLHELLSGVAASSSNTLVFETVHQRKDASTYCCSISLHRSVLEESEVFVAFVRDITEQKKLETQLVDARKLESVGQLAAGVAHEINTPMQCVFGNVEFLQASFDRLLALSDRVVKMLEAAEVDWSKERKTLEELREEYRYDFLRAQTPAAIEEASEASTRVISIIRAMKIMSHPGSKEKTATDIHDMIQNAAMITRSRWKNCAEIVFEFSPELNSIEVLPAEISQVFMNLIVNASDAIHEKMGSDSMDRGTILIKTEISGDWAIFKFSDTGSGIPDDVMGRIFDPFFTTKEVGQGTGQGLSISRDVIVKGHSGTMDVSSEVGKGTTFIIKVPRFTAPQNCVDDGGDDTPQILIPNPSTSIGPANPNPQTTP